MSSRKLPLLFLTILFLLLMILGGCSKQEAPVSPSEETKSVLDRQAAKEAFLEASRSNDNLWTYDEVLADMALEVSGYGGHFVDEDGILTVYLLSDEKREAIKETLTRSREIDNLGGVTDERLASMHVRQGHFDFLQLYSWRGMMREHILGLEGVTLLDIDERYNQIMIGIEDFGRQQKYREKILKLGIPESAVRFVEKGLFNYELRSYRNDLAGGLQVELGNGTSGICTLGPVALRDGIKGFIVNSHCTGTRGTVDNTYFFQPDEHPFRLIAVEVLDPPFFTSSPCPSGKQCAYADAAFAQWPDIRNWKFGRIHETQYSGHSIGSTNSVGANFVIQTATVWPYPGQLVQKVGSTTGWTYGNVTQTNVDIGAGNNIVMLSQILADYGSGAGDSGSPVFERLSNKNVSLLGIHWGGSGSTKGFSFTGYIIHHLDGNVSFK